MKLKRRKQSTFPGKKSLPCRTLFTEVFSIAVTKMHMMLFAKIIIINAQRSVPQSAETVNS